MRSPSQHQSECYGTVVEMLRSGCDVHELARELKCPERLIREWAKKAARPESRCKQPAAKQTRMESDQPPIAAEESIAAWLRGLS